LDAKGLLVRQLMENIVRFNRMHWNKSPIPGLTHSELVVLHLIEGHENQNKSGIKVSELSELLKVTSPTVTQLIKSLKKKGLVERNIDKSDRRVVLITLTKEGEKIDQTARESFTDFFNDLVDYLGVEESNKLNELLMTVCNYLRPS